MRGTFERFFPRKSLSNNHQDDRRSLATETKASEINTSSISTSSEGGFQRGSNNESELISIFCISDTHNGHNQREFDRKIREVRGDILIHAGDFSDGGTSEETEDFLEWLKSLNNFQYKIFISGNMDGIGLENSQRKSQFLSQDDPHIIYLENESCNVLGLNMYGCPKTPKFYGGFQYTRNSSEAKRLWNDIPRNCDLLISHGPPADILDKSSRGK